jgi:hypothetical protein
MGPGPDLILKKSLWAPVPDTILKKSLWAPVPTKYRLNTWQGPNPIVELHKITLTVMGQILLAFVNQMVG